MDGSKMDGTRATSMEGLEEASGGRDHFTYCVRLARLWYCIRSTRSRSRREGAMPAGAVLISSGAKVPTVLRTLLRTVCCI